ncbi:DUF6346 domain-containing protein [Actinoplanes sp. NEAU-A12]|uniref:DUF6346 domain-containing protein n=1 Tax=Actinoplanes sandaracinus TaxID=3045177 RepID=A0ABT6WMS6_9ACTN|nr:DUF6346 domain-containing protein [Actinoplanes sandaracinus]MDI6100955.1 DUF6346 domain-containing protein [Actinoplanes sandaracinus]
MESRDDRTARRLAEIRALKAQLDREESEREAASSGPQSAVVSRRSGSAIRSAAVLAGIVLLSLVLLGSGITLIRLAGRDFEDADRSGRAAVDHCREHGPVSNKGFGYWHRCDVTVRWDDGDIDDLVNDGIFSPADIGRDIRVGDHGLHKQSRQLSREDRQQRQWLTWLGFPLAIAALLPGFIAVLMIRELLRFRRRR